MVPIEKTKSVMVATLRNQGGDKVTRSEILNDGMKHHMYDCGLCDQMIAGPELWRAGILKLDEERTLNKHPKRKRKYNRISTVYLCEDCHKQWNKNWLRVNWGA